MSSQTDRSGTGRVISFWLPNVLIEKLERIKDERGVKRNRAARQLIEEARDPADPQ